MKINITNNITNNIKNRGANMKTLIIYKSTNKRNTEKIAKIMAEEMNADIAKVDNIQPEDLLKYDLIGFGSGIYAAKFHKKMYNFIEKMPSKNRNVFIFCTSASGKLDEKQIRGKLSDKGCKIVGEYSCAGEFNMLGLTLDKKGHPDQKDMESARIFAKNLLN